MIIMKYGMGASSSAFSGACFPFRSPDVADFHVRSSYHRQRRCIYLCVAIFCVFKVTHLSGDG